MDWKKRGIERDKKQCEDAVQALEFLLNCFEKMENSRMHYKRVRTALIMAITAVKIQTPKKVQGKSCPTCGRLVGLCYCECCGQRLER